MYLIAQIQRFGHRPFQENKTQTTVTLLSLSVQLYTKKHFFTRLEYVDTSIRTLRNTFFFDATK